MKVINTEYINVPIDGYFNSTHYLPISAEILDISNLEMSPTTLMVLYQKDIGDNTRTKYYNIQVRMNNIHDEEMHLPFWGVSTTNKSVLRMSGNSIEIDNISIKYYIFVEVEKTISEIRDEKIKKLIGN